MALSSCSTSGSASSCYTTVTGKGDTGLPHPLPSRVAILAYGIRVPWAIFTVVIYAIILVGGFVRTMGRDYTLRRWSTTSRRSASSSRSPACSSSGSAWNSFFTTVQVAAWSAPLTAAIGILTAWLLTRNRFAGQRLFEFGTMLSFAIPGTVVGVSYILAFNVPPIELTGTGLILVICFIFRNMPVGVRSGIAGLSQLDKSLDEASLTLGARSFTTLRKVVLPLLRPAIVASLVYSFVRAMTALSAVIFLVSAQYNLATNLYRRARGGRRIRSRHRLFVRPDRRDGDGHRPSSRCLASGGSDGGRSERFRRGSRLTHDPRRMTRDGRGRLLRNGSEISIHEPPVLLRSNSDTSRKRMAPSPP